MTEDDAKSFALFKGWTEDSPMEFEAFIRSSIEDSSKAILEEWKESEKIKALVQAEQSFNDEFDQKIEDGLSVTVE